jgi:hypothetical protein
MEEIKHLRRSASSRTPSLRLQLARVYWRPVPSAHRLVPSRPGLTKELVISQSCAVLSGTALCPDGLLEAVLCGCMCMSFLHPLRPVTCPADPTVGEGRAAGRLWSRKTGSVCVCDHPIPNCFSARLDGRVIWVSSRCQGVAAALRMSVRRVGTV